MHRTRLSIFLTAALAVSLCQAKDSLTRDQAVEKIDQFIVDAWQANDIQPTHLSTDAEFCRRVWLDLAGVAPPISFVQTFLKDSGPDKRNQLIQSVLNGPQYATNMAARWTDILVPTDTQAQRQSATALNRWLRQKFAQNLPYDHLVGGFLTAGGSSDVGPAVFYTSRELEPEKLAAATSQIFLGIQLQCAQCHDHPFDQWSQEDFWAYAAFFSQLSQADSPVRGQTIIEDRPGGEVTLPETETVVAPNYPGSRLPPEPDPGNVRRRQLTIWMASRDNPYLARAAVNRVWGHLFGRGLVDPVDNMDAGNKASHPELLEFLADYFVQTRFDLRELYATIASSKVYQLSSATNGARPADDSFAAQQVKTLTAIQLYNCLQQNVFRQTLSGDAAQFAQQQFVERLKANGASPTEYPHGVVQVLSIMNGPDALRATNATQGLLASVQAPFFEDDDRINAIYLATVSRMPTDTERERLDAFFQAAKTDDDKKAFQGDLLWSLINSAEFAVCP